MSVLVVRLVQFDSFITLFNSCTGVWLIITYFRKRKVQWAGGTQLAPGPSTQLKVQ